MEMFKQNWGELRWRRSRGVEVYKQSAACILFPFVTCPRLLTISFKVVLTSQMPFHPGLPFLKHLY